LDREPLLSPSMLDLTKWISDYYLCSWGQVLDSVIPAGVRKQAGTREILTFKLNPEVDLSSLKLTAKQKAIIEALQSSTELLTIDQLSERAQCGTSPIDTLRRKGL